MTFKRFAWFSPRSCLIWTPRIEKIVQAAKQTVKAMVESHNARACSPALGGSVVVVGMLRSMSPNCLCIQRSRAAVRIDADQWMGRQPA